VLALARHLGLANTTFRRNFPAITTQLTKHRATALDSPDPAAGASRLQRLQRDNTALRAANHDLSEHLK
jgi:hypothetical protein